MPILKKVTYDNGATPEYHIVRSLKYEFELRTATANVVSYTDEAAYLAGKNLSANWNIDIPAAYLVGEVDTSVEQYLITGAASPFNGGVLIVNGLTSLTNAKAQQIYTINQYCQAEIYAGFACHIGVAKAADDGSVVLEDQLFVYPAKAQDQSNLVASVTASLYPNLPDTWTTPFWCADTEGNWAYRNHTALQIQTVGVAGKQAIVDCLAKNELLKSYVDAATDVTVVQSIIW